MAQVNNTTLESIEDAIALHDAIVNAAFNDVARIVDAQITGDYVKVKCPTDIGSVLLWQCTHGKHGLSPLQLNTVLTRLAMTADKLTKAQQKIVLAAGHAHPDSGTRAQFAVMMHALGLPDASTWAREGKPSDVWASMTPRPQRKRRTRKTASKTASKTAEKVTA